MLDTIMMYFGYAIGAILLAIPVLFLLAILWVHLSISAAFAYAVSMSGASVVYYRRPIAAFFSIAKLPKATFSAWCSTVTAHGYYQLNLTGWIPKVVLYKRAQEAGDE